MADTLKVRSSWDVLTDPEVRAAVNAFHEAQFRDLDLAVYYNVELAYPRFKQYFDYKRVKDKDVVGNMENMIRKFTEMQTLHRAKVNHPEIESSGDIRLRKGAKEYGLAFFELCGPWQDYYASIGQNLVELSNKIRLDIDDLLQDTVVRDELIVKAHPNFSDAVKFHLLQDHVFVRQADYMRNATIPPDWTRDETAKRVLRRNVFLYNVNEWQRRYS
jgi:hypothetical protein